MGRAVCHGSTDAGDKVKSRIYDTKPSITEKKVACAADEKTVQHYYIKNLGGKLIVAVPLLRMIL